MRTNSASTGLRTLVWILLLGGAAAGGYYYFKRQSTQGAIEYRTSTVARGDIVQTVTANGSLLPVRSIQVGSQISGTITAIKVDFNSKVKAGEIVAQIDPATYERALLQAEAELDNAKASRGMARLNLKRSTELHTSKLVSESEFNQAEVDLQQAEAVVKMREANVERAKVDLDRTTIYAPIDGFVISRNIEVGQTVAASLNTPTLFLIANDLARMQIEAAVSEADVGGVEEGQTVNFLVDAFPGRQFKGKVRQVRFAPITNQNVVTYTTVVDVDNADLKLRPGMTANASFVTAEKKRVLLLPNAALRFRPPTNAIVQAPPVKAGITNATTSATPAPAQEIATSGPFAGLPVPPWSAGGQFRRPSEDERATYMASLTEDQKQKYQQVMTEMRSRMGQGGGGRGGGGGGEGGGSGATRARTPDGPRSQTLYLMAGVDESSGRKQPVLKPVTVKTGLTDSINTEILEGLNEGDVVASGIIVPVSTTTTASATPGGSSPFGGSPFGGGGPRVR